MALASASITHTHTQIRIVRDLNTLLLQLSVCVHTIGMGYKICSRFEANFG